VCVCVCVFHTRRANRRQREHDLQLNDDDETRGKQQARCSRLFTWINRSVLCVYPIRYLIY
jgi:hypothetical protein